MDIKPNLSSLPALSTEIWQTIFRHAFNMAVEPKDQFEKRYEYLWSARSGSERRSTVVSVMQTCRSWYSMTWPIVYKDVTVRDLASYLCGVDQPSNPPNSSLISKRRLLAETRCLCVVPGLESYKWHMLHNYDSRKELEAHIAEQTMRDEAGYLLNLICHSSSPIFLNLQILQLGLPDFDGHRRETSDVILGAKLLRACRPKRLCVHGTALEYAYPTQTRANDYADGILPDEVITHVNVGMPFSIMWGTKNWVFLMDWGDCNSYREDGENGWSVIHQTYLEQYIKNSIPVWGPPKSDVLMDLLRKTTIRVDGVMESWANDEDDTIDDADQISAVDMRVLEQNLRRVLQNVLGGTNEEWNKAITLTCGDDRPPCPVCKVGIFFN